MTLKGIDVSLYQGNIDWEKVKKSGIDFAIIKASQGDTSGSHFKDPKFEYNIKAAYDAGINLGVYHYYKGNETETDYFLSVIKPHFDKISLYAALDVEDGNTLGNYTKEQLTEKVKTALSKIKTAGFTPCLYANTNWLNTKVNPSGFAVWEASWGSYKPQRAQLVMWQYSSSGTVDGITGSVDLNYGYFVPSGDVNSDGLVNTDDVIQLIRYNAGWSSAKIDPIASDLNADGKINTSDVLDLMKNIASGNSDNRIKVGDTVKVINPIDYDTGKEFTTWNKTYTVMEINNDRAVIGVNGVVTAAINVSNLTPV